MAELKKVENAIFKEHSDGVAIKDCECCCYGKEVYDYRGCGYYICRRPGGCYDSETYKIKTFYHDPRIGI